MWVGQIMQATLASKLKEKVADWRKNGYASEYPAITEILEYAFVNSQTGESLRFLRKAQLEALEAYWYLRIVEKTPHIFDLYKKEFQNKELLESLGIRLTSDDLQEMLFEAEHKGVDKIFERIKNDDKFVRKYKLETVRETLTLEYPSYILALAMGAVKRFSLALSSQQSLLWPSNIQMLTL